MFLYRVQHRGSRARFHDGGDLDPQGEKPFDQEDFKQRLSSHLAWSNASSCFLSVFDNEQQAWNWADQRVSNGHDPAIVYHIKVPNGSTSPERHHTQLYHLRSTLAELDLERPAFVTNGEYVILGRVRSKYMKAMGVVCGVQGEQNSRLSNLAEDLLMRTARKFGGREQQIAQFRREWKGAGIDPLERRHLL